MSYNKKTFLAGDFMEELFKQIIGRLDRLDGRMDNIEKTMATKDELEQFKKTTEEEFKQIRQTMATKDELEEIKQTMATKVELEEIKQNMATKDEMKEIKDSINILAQDQRNDVIAILQRLDNNVIEIKSDVKHLSEIQKRQQDVIELLSSRSIKQESEIIKIQKVIETNIGNLYGE